MKNRDNIQHKLLKNISLTASKLHHEGKINEEIFNKFLEFLRNYYKNAYENEDCKGDY